MKHLASTVTTSYDRKIVTTSYDRKIQVTKMLASFEPSLRPKESMVRRDRWEAKIKELIRFIPKILY